MRAFSFVGDSGVGKTALLVQLTKILTSWGIDVRAVKHSQGFDDPDPAGKDSRRIREAGAGRVVLASSRQTVLVWDHPEGEPKIEERLRLLGDTELVLVESFRTSRLPIVEVLRAALPRREPRTDPGDPNWIGLVSDFEPARVPTRVRRFSLEDAPTLARFLLDWTSP